MINKQNYNLKNINYDVILRVKQHIFRCFYVTLLYCVYFDFSVQLNVSLIEMIIKEVIGAKLYKII